MQEEAIANETIDDVSRDSRLELYLVERAVLGEGPQPLYRVWQAAVGAIEDLIGNVADWNVD